MQTVHKRVTHSNGDVTVAVPAHRGTKKKKRVKRRKIGSNGDMVSDACKWCLFAILLFALVMDLYFNSGRADLPENHIYQIPDAHKKVGDRSDEYARLRDKYDNVILPLDYRRSLEAVEEMAERSTFNLPAYPVGGQSDEFAGGNSYDIFNCPESPPEGYPYSWKLADLLRNWPADEPDARPSGIYQGLCVFDYELDFFKALRYREAELPFVTTGDPEVARTVERWMHPGYMQDLMADVRHRVEYSHNNQFMYYVPLPKRVRKGKKQRKPSAVDKRVKIPENWTAPTELLRMTYQEWLTNANVTNDKLGPDQDHWYFRLIGCGFMGASGECDKGSSEYLFDELPFFQPKKGLYLTHPDEQKGIHCRFGMKGVIAENHFDGTRNAITVLGGSRRYILAHPDQCEKLNLYPKSHPSARHSEMDWSHPDYEKFPEFLQAQGNEVILKAGDVLWLPTYWFHFIVSLELNFQCNTRSGKEQSRYGVMEKCGF